MVGCLEALAAGRQQWKPKAWSFGWVEVLSQLDYTVEISFLVLSQPGDSFVGGEKGRTRRPHDAALRRLQARL